MKPTKIGTRVVLIGRTAPANDKAGSTPPSQQRPTTRRIGLIRNNERVGRRPRR
jgi:hypothetical protein